MTDKVTEAISHNYEPVNKYIDDQARLKRSASSWRYAKATALLMVAAGILAVLLAWVAKQGNIVVFITHRLNTIQNADKIILLHQGSISEVGKHTELMKKAGRYYTLYNQQDSQ